MPQLTRALAVATAMLALAAPPAIAGPPVEVSIHIGEYLSTVNGASGGSGWSRLTITADRRLSVGILRTKPDTDTGYLANAIGDMPVTKYGKWGTWIARGVTAPGKPYVTTIDTIASRRYAIVAFQDIMVDDAHGDTYGTGDWAASVNPGGGEPPATTASIELTDTSIEASGLTSTGPVKVVNAGRRMHELAAYPLAKGVKPAQALKLARQGAVRKVKTAGAPVQIMGLVDDKTTQYLEPNLKPGTYLLVCGEGQRRKAAESHAALGQATIVTVG